MITGLTRAPVRNHPGLKSTACGWGCCGDFVLDGYWYADMTRAQLSRETPLYNRPVVAETYSPGGAANVAWNLADLGVGEVHAISVLGKDWRGSLLEGNFPAFGDPVRSTCSRGRFGKPHFMAKSCSPAGIPARKTPAWI